MKVILLLGSNVEKELNIPRAYKHLEHDADISVCDQSWVCESDAIGLSDGGLSDGGLSDGGLSDGGLSGSPRFHNQAVAIETSLDLETLRRRLKEMETRLGRIPSTDSDSSRADSHPDPARPIDIDLIATIDDGVLTPLESGLVEYHHIAFPVAEIVGHLRLPDRRPLREHLQQLAPPPPGFYRVGIRPIPPPPSTFQIAEELEIALEGEWVEKLGQFLTLLLSTNERFNLTAVTDANEAWSRHLLDSLSLVHAIDFIGGERIADIGSGGGLPGIPLAIALPEVNFTLIEATGKKTDFLSAVARDLQLDNVEVINGRAEDLGHSPEHRGEYDVVIARGVGPLRVLLELTAPLARVGGGVLAMKGEKAAEEVAEAKKALRELRCRVVGEEPTPTGTIVMIEKIDGTPKAYPRRAGEPKRSPLGSTTASISKKSKKRFGSRPKRS